MWPSYDLSCDERPANCLHLPARRPARVFHRKAGRADLICASLAAETRDPAAMKTDGGLFLQNTITVFPKKAGAYLITGKVAEAVPGIKDIKAGWAHVFVKGRGALSINENADPLVRSDMMAALDKIAGPGGDRGLEKTSLVGVGLNIPIHDGKLALGTWQGLYFFEWEGCGEGGRELVVTAAPLADVKLTRRSTINASKRGCHLLTRELMSALPQAQGDAIGLANFFILHTSASLTINENADATVRSDMEAALNHICPDAWSHSLFEHVDEGEDDMPAHVKSTLVGPSVTLPVGRGGRPLLGTWQGLYLNEHRNVGGYGTGHSRDVVATLLVPSLSDPKAVTSQATVTVTAPSRGCHPITDKVLAAVAKDVARCTGAGLLCCFIQHTSASLTVNEEKSGARLEAALNQVVPEAWNQEFFKHTYEGPDDMPGHVKSSLFGASVTIPIHGGKLQLAEGQGILLCEHRNSGGWGGGHSRQIVCSVVGSAS
eukprot:jgi/Mesvir1/21801/Mv04192-RA.1